MAQVALSIGGNSYTIGCKDGEEDHLRAIAALVDAKAVEARSAVGGVNEARQLVFASLLLADELQDARRGIAPTPKPVPQQNDTANLALFEDIASRLEALASTLENAG